MEYSTLLLTLACIFGFLMAWGIGANDVANAMGTSVGSKALTLKQAIIIAAIFETAGALLAGDQVTDTIRHKLIDSASWQGPPELLVYGMLAALLAAGTWLIIASHFGWPVSTTHSIVGAIIGFAATQLGVHAVHWNTITQVVLSWVLTPFIAGIIAYLLFRSIQRLILLSRTPLSCAKRYLPYYIFVLAMLICMSTLNDGLHHLGLNPSFTFSLLLSLTISTLCFVIGIVVLHHIASPRNQREETDFRTVEKAFGLLMLFTACSMAYAHGSNDVSNAIGPLSAVVHIINSGTTSPPESTVPFWILGLGALGIISGLTMYGYRVIETIGNNLTELTPSRGFAAGLATASTVMFASGIGLPVSTTQTLVGAILGVGLAGGIGALRLNVIRNIFTSWVITLPAGAVLAVLFFHVLRLSLM